MNDRHVLITGVTGFVGQALTGRLHGEDWRLRGTLRSLKNAATMPHSLDLREIRSFDAHAGWSSALNGIDIVVHLAGRVHIMKETSKDPLAEFRRVNVAGTECLSRRSVEAGVRRFIFLSSVHVNGTATYERAFTEEDEPNPFNDYGLSKLEAEETLRDIASGSGMEVVVIRSPLVYGPHNGGNFLRLLQMVVKGLPMPFASVKNRRSLIYISNLTDAIAACMIHPEAAGRTYLVSDGEDVSTPELIRRVGTALGRPARLVSFPPGLLRTAGRIMRKSAPLDRLLGSLMIDSSRIRRELHWVPPYTMDRGLRQTAEWFKKASGKHHR